MFVRLFFRTEHFGFYWTNFYEIWYENILRKYVEKIKISLKSEKDRISGILHEDQ